MEACTNDRLDRRRDAFIDAARQLFIDQGFERTALSEVVERAGGSLSTLYKLFGNKAGLLAAVVEEQSRDGESLIVEVGESGVEPCAALHTLGAHLHDKLLDPEAVAISRVVMAYSLEDAGFAREFHRKTLQRACRNLTDLFEGWRRKGIAFHGEPATLAAIFIGMLVYELHSEAISHGAYREDGASDLDSKIDFFCRGAGLPPA